MVHVGYHPTPARLGVSAQEFHLTLSRPQVRAGVLEIELQNDGEDPHDDITLLMVRVRAELAAAKLRGLRAALLARS